MGAAFLIATPLLASRHGGSYNNNQPNTPAKIFRTPQSCFCKSTRPFWRGLHLRSLYSRLEPNNIS